MVEPSRLKKKWTVKRTIAISIVAILTIAGILLYNNFNQLLSNAVLQNFNSNIISDVYELKFEKLRVNPFEGTLRISNVTLLPREKPLKDYPYINSSFRLKTEKITLKNVTLFDLLQSNRLEVERISITEPDVELQLSGDNYVLFPFEDSTAVATTSEKNEKKAFDYFRLIEFQLIDASIHTTNSHKQREFKIQKFNISLHNLLLQQEPGKHIIALHRADVSIKEFEGRLEKGPLRHVSVREFHQSIDSLNLQNTLDTLLYNFHDLTTRILDLDLQTADSIFHVTLQSFDLSYQNKSINMKQVSFKPNVSHDVLQKEHTYQHAEFSGSAGSLDIRQVNFDSLIYAKKLFADEIVLDEVRAFVFKDKTKPLDKNRFPVYLGQTIAAIPVPLMIKHVKATHVHLENTERKPDSTYVKVNLTQATLAVEHLTNLDPTGNLAVKADAFIEDKAHFYASLSFPYQKPQFAFEALVKKFNLADLNPMIQAYTPAKINAGVADEITFSGLAEQTKATGTFKFLYHDLKIDLELHNQAKWKSAVVAFAANSIIDASNPSATDLPARVVKFQIDRDMSKGFVNVVIKSLLNGLKETMIMSKENRNAYQAAKKKKKSTEGNK